MATVKLISKTSTVKKLIAYITQEKKTSRVSGINCSVENAAAEMYSNKLLHRKTSGRQAFHMVQSWKPGEITPELAHELGKRLIEECKLLSGFQVIVATHTDVRHVHNHFCIDSVALDGHKLHTSKADLAAIKELSDALCREYGLSICEPHKDRTCPVAYNQATYRLLEKAAAAEVDSYVHNAALAVIEAKQKATSKEDFMQQLREKGIAAEWTENRKYITFTDVERQQGGFKQCKIRNNKLEKYYPGVGFEKADFLQAFEQNRNAQQLRKEPKKEKVVAAPTPEVPAALVAEMTAELQQLLREVTWQARAEHREKI